MDSSEIMISSLSNATIRQYDTGLKKWWSYCRDAGISWNQATLIQVLSFLTRYFREGFSHGTLNSFRSSISLIDGPHVGENPKVKSFFRGVFSLRPSRPKYSTTWDPAIVLSHLTAMDKNNKLSLLDLTEKLATLLALVTTHRVQTLSLIDVCNIRTTDQNDIIIQIPEKIKHRHQTDVNLSCFYQNLRTILKFVRLLQFKTIWIGQKFCGLERTIIYF